MTMILMIMMFAVQTLLCFRVGSWRWKLVPLLAGVLLEAVCWGLMFLVPNPEPGAAVLIITLVMGGIALLGGVTLGWFVYGVIRAVKRIIHQ